MSTKKLSPLLVIFLTVFIDLLGFGIIIPLSPYYTQHFGGTAFEVGLLAASYSLAQFIFAPFWGRLSDRIGRRPVLLFSILCNSASYALFAAADSLFVLFLARILQGTFSANISTAQAYVADITPHDQRSKSMGLLGAAFGLGFIFGPAIGAKLSELGPAVGAAFGYEGTGVFGMGFPGLVSSLLCFLNFLLAVFILPETLTKEIREKNKNSLQRKSRFLTLIQHFKNPKLGWLLFVFFLASFAMTNMESTLALFAEKRLGFGVAQTGKLFAYIGIVIAFTQGFLIRKFLTIFGENKIMVYGPILAGFSLLATVFIFSFTPLLIAMAILAIGSGLCNPSFLGSISKIARAEEQGEVLGVTQSLGSLARIMGPITGGYLFGNISSGAPYWLAGLCMLFCAWLVLVKTKPAK